ncbi:MAG: bifunctional DNA-formamidopyrimidine glycosylase/DNA-(apurinic or apyrimidinic site) lyase [Armatimonadetes bacterium]|nr:bifunctional DNA-formamidopyrimidine glycosylase/DNA-(apurinic or apyrimidinic site) lyase [Armatimonadota bacterium]NIM23704.1 bifunctional DNA-formamidopyrimidine glycosylase/DNA-(apurinic or apyrimidinic site) lyase [Armatimonadota bacterium]NIM67581.1 bifunctional DNA-formamidopyrimidine glycosylase/DNA-(apurinic or apyrimidinic site) lyase [Armatimonadota bacterium]NIM76104.1 bifunctional DNA-formamidopyrimidine glycosylase/DNA-(apurinic or apyrimidinic site) lyase [Armatimonadota bacter
MPELPEAETICRQLSPLTVGRRIISVSLREPRILRCPIDAAKFRRGLKGRRISRLLRRGKAIIFVLEGARCLVVRLGMSGTLKVEPAELTTDKHVHLRLGLEGGDELRFRDPRKFGCLALRTGTEVEAFPEFSHYGPEPLSAAFTPSYLAQRLKGRRAKVGVVLMDQSVVAGLGKIYADEICFRAGVRPGRAAGRLTKKEIEKLVAATREVLEEAIGDRGTTAEDSVYQDAYGLSGGFRPAVYQRTDQPCIRCGQPIRRTRLTDGRGMHWCPECQK